MLPVEGAERSGFETLGLSRVLDKEPGERLRLRLDRVGACLLAGLANHSLICVFQHLEGVERRRFPHERIVLLLRERQANARAVAVSHNPEPGETSPSI